MKRKLLIINKVPFGYHTDSYKYCQYLKDEFEITYLCLDQDKKKIFLDDIQVVYFPYLNTHSNLRKALEFVYFCRNYIQRNNFDLIFVVYFQMASLIRIAKPLDKFILDIRTGAIGRSKKRRKLYNTIMVIESKFYKNLTIISDSLRQKLKLNTKKCHILPLGADELSKTNKSFEFLRLIYVGTLSSRHIEETVIGLSKFIEKNNVNKLTVSYDIFGSGTVSEEALLLSKIEKSNLSEIVKFHGRKTHEQIKDYFDKCNVGISYVPLVDYFECQPPTKIFEYIRSGMYCIATDTIESKKLINKNNGTLCKDNPESFSQALEYVYINCRNFRSKYIRESLYEFSWFNIVNYNLKNYLNYLL